MTIKNADLIRSCLGGKQIQVKNLNGLVPIWQDYPAQTAIAWLAHPDVTGMEFRIKPEPAPDWVMQRSLCVPDVVYCKRLGKTAYDSIQATYDGETGKLKKVELI